ncbi:hypothetical protein CRG98_039780 [Punica granatum]|uniref:F-box domain-containing protein n=1 Tax=Punica granatum TaxID=22663 RepID=A0A2I0I7R5_PUNGR|nr:hypothetical protein CRG98_039780 [Punica granatum]
MRKDPKMMESGMKATGPITGARAKRITTSYARTGVARRWRSRALERDTFGTRSQDRLIWKRKVTPLDVLGNASSRCVPSRAVALYEQTPENETTAPGKLTGSIEPQSTADWCFGWRPSVRSPVKVGQERPLLQSTDDEHAGCEDRLKCVDQDPESSAREMQCIEQKADISQIELQDPLAEKKVFVPTNQGQAADCSNQFCNLPDEVLVQILSLLALKDEVRTSVLSKRWEHLWALVPDLHFRDSDLSKRPLFLGLVGRALALRGGSPIRTFSLSCKADGAEAHIKELIASAVTCGVQNLSLFLPEATLASSIYIYVCNLRKASSAIRLLPQTAFFNVPFKTQEVHHFAPSLGPCHKG